MGSFYTNYALRNVTQPAVIEPLGNRPAFVSPAIRDVVVVFDKQSDDQDTNIISTLASDLSVRCGCAVLATLNHDDDVLWYQLFSSGNLVDEYNSCPGYFSDDGIADLPSGGDAAALSAAFGSRNVADVDVALRESDNRFTFAIERHAALAHALGLPSFVVGGGYSYIDGGEVPDGLEPEDLVRTPA